MWLWKLGNLTINHWQTEESTQAQSLGTRSADVQRQEKIDASAQSERKFALPHSFPQLMG